MEARTNRPTARHSDMLVMYIKLRADETACWETAQRMHERCQMDGASVPNVNKRSKSWRPPVIILLIEIRVNHGPEINIVQKLHPPEFLRKILRREEESACVA